jgi:HlyD family secretion protein
MAAVSTDSNTPDDTDEVRETIRTNRTRSWWTWGIVIVVLLGLVGAVVWWWQSGEQKTRYRTVSADRGDIVLTATATGSLEPKRRVTVGAEVSGQIEEVVVGQNDRVEKDDVLARFDTEELTNSLDQSKANLAQARASLEQARASLEEAEFEAKRTKRLYETGSTSEQSLERARAERRRAAAQVESARASVRQARAAVEVDRTNLEQATIVSPVDGVVLSRSVEPGNTVAASFQTPELFILAEDLREMELHVGVDEADVGLVQEGQSATFTVDAWPDRTFDAEVQLVALQPTITNNVVTYTTELDVDNPERLLRPGMTATATIQTGRREDVLRVPNTALRFLPPKRDEKGGIRIGPGRDDEREPDRDTVYQLVDGEPKKVHVTTGRSDGRHTEIESGEIEAGDRLVTGIEESSKQDSASSDGDGDDESDDSPETSNDDESPSSEASSSDEEAS